ncbi:methylmalonyl-CoA mutase [Rhodobacteraceae bacterium HSP-20]|uniref:Methylmalonyl-CoA mutase n=1 Tax=Paragemmobacter amnigenus TaxID=2852097 RepID=A0ABS6J9D6_9RHOB|nr:methylmalonyl-CoA mutase family protein [Rhodobacter amnigenus]MBU9698985.1 methylmalonyl-CoA mutase [Rhodobacter amnigenus]MBV4390212.1 methylmalonyl-CoA mutase [Rhodobacter amnigenus]
MTKHDIFQPATLKKLEKQFADWEANELAESLGRRGESKDEFRTEAGIEIKRVYTQLDIADIPPEDIGLPGQYPFTRGPYPTMYRARPWTIRQVSGYGNAEDTNARYKYLIAAGQTGTSTDFDMPTLMGYDSDHPMAFGEVGREGVAIDTLDDMEALFDGIDLNVISASLTINPTAFIIYAMWVAAAKKRGYDPQRLMGTIQADILKEYVAQKEWIFPVRPSVRLVRDTILYSAEHTKRFNPISISGYHVSEVGGNAVHEVAFTISFAISYIEECRKLGMSVDEFAPRLSFFYVCQADFFEEIAKFRAARRVYAKVIKERFGAELAESMRMRMHVQTAAMTLTKPQYRINLMRTAVQALAAVLGGAQSMHTNGFDEAFTIPTAEAMKLAIRTQQILAEETNVTSIVDPLGGSYAVEALTSEFEAKVFDMLKQIDDLGGAIKAVEAGWMQRICADTAYEYELRKARGERTVIGVNKYVEEDEEPADFAPHPYDEGTLERQLARLNRVRAERDTAKVHAILERMKVIATDEKQNLLPVTMEAVEAKATLGEICDALRSVWGVYREEPIF